MTVQDMITELNDHGFSDESDIAKTRVLQHTIWDIEGREQWPFLEDTATLNWDGTSPAPTNLPTNFRSVRRVRMVGPGNLRLRPVRMEELEDLAYGDYVGVGVSQVYYFDGLKLNLWPQPQADSSATLRYIKWSDPITSTSPESALLLPKYHHRLPVYGALWKLYDMEDDPELAQRFESHYETGINQMRQALWLRQTDQPDHIAVIDPDDYYGEY